MPRFLLQVHDNYPALDLEGTELPNWPAARLEAIRLAGDILKHDAHRIPLAEDWRIEVTDRAGLILFQMTFLVVEPRSCAGGAVGSAQSR